MNIERDESIPTRRSLLVKLKDLGDNDSWQRFFDTYGRLIYNTAIKGGLRHEEAEDVLQETLRAVCKAMPGFEYDSTRGSFKGWLYTITRRKMLDYIDRVRKKDVSSSKQVDDEAEEGILERISDPASVDFDVWEREWQQNLYDAAVKCVRDRISPKTFQLFELHILQNWPVSKIVQTMEVNRVAVHLAKHRVSKMIEKEVRRLQREMI